MQDAPPVITLISHRRGEGVTTLAVKLADQLARRGFRILVVSADAKADTAAELGYESPGAVGPWTAYHVAGAGLVSLAELRLPETPLAEVDVASLRDSLALILQSDFDAVIVEAAGHYVQVAEPGEEWFAEALDIDGEEGSCSRPEWQRIAGAAADLVLTCWNLSSVGHLEMTQEVDPIFERLEDLFHEYETDDPAPDEQEDPQRHDDWFRARCARAVAYAVGEAEREGRAEYGDTAWEWSSAWWTRYQAGFEDDSAECAQEGDLNLVRVAAFMRQWHDGVAAPSQAAVFIEGEHKDQFEGAEGADPAASWSRAAKELEGLSGTRTFGAFVPYLAPGKFWRLNADPGQALVSVADDALELLAASGKPIRQRRSNRRLSGADQPNPSHPN